MDDGSPDENTVTLIIYGGAEKQDATTARI
jgi:hypothetical protein